MTQATPGLPAESMEDGVQILRVPPYFQAPHDFRLWVCHLNFALLEAGAALLRSLDGPVILHAHDWLVAHAAKGLKSLFHLPLVATVHATEHGRHGGIQNAGQQYINDVEWWLTYEAWRVIVCSHAMRAEVRGLFGLARDKVMVIPNGVEPAPPATPFDAHTRATFLRPGERLLFFVGRLVPEKGVAVLLRALPLLLPRHHVRLVIGGVGPQAEELQRLACQLAVADRVHFAGWLADGEVQAFYRAADVAVVPSTYEPFGIVALEAMAVGTPLVVTAVGGLAEIIRHGENGLKARPGDPVSLARQIDRLLTDRRLAAQLARAARQEAAERYSWSAIASTTAALYTDVVSAWSQTEWGAVDRQRLPPFDGNHRPTPGRYST